MSILQPAFTKLSTGELSNIHGIVARTLNYMAPGQVEGRLVICRLTSGCDAIRNAFGARAFEHSGAHVRVELRLLKLDVDQKEQHSCRPESPQL